MRLIWSVAALRDLDEIAEYIGSDSERASEWIETRIHQESRLLSQFPQSGRIGRVAGTRERVVGRTPYILAYRFISGKVRILRVFHSARKWPRRF